MFFDFIPSQPNVIQVEVPPAVEEAVEVSRTGDMELPDDEFWRELSDGFFQNEGRISETAKDPENATAEVQTNSAETDDTAELAAFVLLWHGCGTQAATRYQPNSKKKEEEEEE